MPFRKQSQFLVSILAFSSLALATASASKSSQKLTPAQIQQQFVTNMKIQQQLAQQQKHSELAGLRVELMDLQSEQAGVEEQKKTTNMTNPMALVKILKRSGQLERKIEIQKKKISSLEKELPTSIR